MSFSTGSSVHAIPFITQGIFFRDDFQDTGSWALSKDSGSLDASGLTANAAIFRNLSSNPVNTSLYPNYAARFKTGSTGAAANIKAVVKFYSGSINLASITGSLDRQNIFYTWTGSFPSNTIIDGIDIFVANQIGAYGVSTWSTDGDILTLTAVPVGNPIMNVDFIMIYNNNLPLNYISNQGKYELARNVAEINAPMREQGIVQSLGSQSPTIDIDGVFINDVGFTAQQYRDKLISVWKEGTWQWLNLDFIQAKFIPEDISVTELAGVINYYQWEMKARQYTSISATDQNYNLS